MSTNQICELCYTPIDDLKQLSYCSLCKLPFHTKCLSPACMQTAYCVKCYSRTGAKQTPFPSSRKKKPSRVPPTPATKSTPKPSPVPVARPVKRLLEGLYHEPFERDDVKGLLRKYAGKKYEEIPNHFKEKIESHYAIKHQQAYYQKKTIRVDAKKYQSGIPRVESNFPDEPIIDLANAREVWNPNILPEEEVERYLKDARDYFMRSKKMENICAGHHKNPEIKIANSIEEVALKVLHLCGYSIKKALYCLVAKSDVFWYDITKQITEDAKQYNIHFSH